jgi:hypothetical protein
MTLSRQTIVGTGIVAAVLTAAALAAANFLGDAGENGGGPAYAVTLAVSLLVAVGLFGWVIPRTTRPARVGLVVGVVALLSIAA